MPPFLKKSLRRLGKISNIHLVKKIRSSFKKHFITGLLVIMPTWATSYALGLVSLSELQADKLKQTGTEAPNL